MQQLDQWRDDDEFLLGDTITLADLHAYPMLRLFIETPEGMAMLESLPRLRQWMQQMQTRDSVRATSFHSTTDTDNGF